MAIFGTALSRCWHRFSAGTPQRAEGESLARLPQRPVKAKPLQDLLLRLLHLLHPPTSNGFVPVSSTPFIVFHVVDSIFRQERPVVWVSPSAVYCLHLAFEIEFEFDFELV